jgi:hypothetical protein
VSWIGERIGQDTWRHKCMMGSIEDSVTEPHTVNSRFCILWCQERLKYQGWLGHVIMEKDGGSACVMLVRLLTLWCGELIWMKCLMVGMKVLRRDKVCAGGG